MRCRQVRRSATAPGVHAAPGPRPWVDPHAGVRSTARLPAHRVRVAGGLGDPVRVPDRLDFAEPDDRTRQGSRRGRGPVGTTTMTTSWRPTGASVRSSVPPSDGAETGGSVTRVTRAGGEDGTSTVEATPVRVSAVGADAGLDRCGCCGRAAGAGPQDEKERRDGRRGHHAGVIAEGDREDQQHHADHATPSRAMPTMTRPCPTRTVARRVCRRNTLRCRLTWPMRNAVAMTDAAMVNR